MNEDQMESGKRSNVITKPCQAAGNKEPFFMHCKGFPEITCRQTHTCPACGSGRGERGGPAVRVTAAHFA